MKYALISTNSSKHQEFVDFFTRYGHSVDLVEPNEHISFSERAQALLTTGYVVVFVEETWLAYRSKPRDRINRPVDASIVLNVSELRAFVLGEDQAVEEKVYQSSHEGFIDFGQAREGDGVFGWDDVFVPILIGVNYHYLKTSSRKNSARQSNLGKFSVDNLFYKKRANLNFDPVDQADTVDFSGAALTFLRNDPILRAGVSGSPLQNVLSQVVQSGVFFRSANNRPEKNYWLPGLNAGIPLTAKKDKVHEITFMFHDLMHFQFPDLVFDGHSELGRKVYILHRMMGEAITLVLADMLFVDNLKRSGIEYDWSKRKIYPLFASLNIDPSSMDDLRSLLHANMRFALFGDDSEFVALAKSGPDGSSALADYKSKYSRFFAEDWKWTAQNYTNMAEQQISTDRWIEETVGPAAFVQAGLSLLSEFCDVLQVCETASNEEIADLIFAHLHDQVLVPNMTKAVDMDVDVAASNAFKRYMIGQMSLFSRFDDLLDGSVIATKLRSMISRTETLSATDIANARALFNFHVEMLIANGILSAADGAIYRSIHPVFQPFYVFYDSARETPLKECAPLYLGDECL